MRTASLTHYKIDMIRPSQGLKKVLIIQLQCYALGSLSDCVYRTHGDHPACAYNDLYGASPVSGSGQVHKLRLDRSGHLFA